MEEDPQIVGCTGAIVASLMLMILCMKEYFGELVVGVEVEKERLLSVEYIMIWLTWWRLANLCHLEEIIFNKLTISLSLRNF